MTSTTRCRSRQIVTSDIDAVADLLVRGFPGRPRDYWMQGLLRQRDRDVPDGYPRYGQVLEHESRLVGVLLLLVTSTSFRDRNVIRCNVASWYVDPEFRGHAPRLVWSALRHPGVTYLNVTPATSTWSIVESLGFKRYCNGLLLTIPVLTKTGRGATCEMLQAASPPIDGVTVAEQQLLRRHADYGCLSVVVRTVSGDAHPFVLTPYRVRRGTIPLPAMQLIFCRDVDDYVSCAGALGRFLLRRRKPIVILDANSPVPGLAGVYTEMRGRKYFRGPESPPLADLADTELVVYGL
jgi:hypothetical protein